MKPIKEVSEINNKFRKYLPVMIIMILTAILIYFFNQTPINKVNKRQGQYYEKGIVTEVYENSLEVDDISGMLTGTQSIRVKVNTGKFKGNEYDIKNYSNYTYNVVCEKGTKLILTIDEAQSGDENLLVVSVYTYDRTNVLIGFLAVFCIVLCIIGGRKGFKSLAALAYTLVCVFFLLIPMMYKGVSPVIASIILAILSTFVTMLLIDGWSAKTISAITGTVICVSLAGVISSIVGGFADINGFTLSDTENLVVAARYNDMKIKGILFAGILISSLGAIMDVAMSIASSVTEIHANSPDISKKKLFRSGIKVGRDMMGTMSNTLILAFTGGSLTMIMLLFSMDVTMHEIFSDPGIVVEIIQGLSGSLGIFLAVPIVAFISSHMLTNKTNINIIYNIKKIKENVTVRTKLI